MAYTCPICGYADLDMDPRFADASTLDCPSCGFEFGITDDAFFVSYEQAREEWIVDGMPWRGPKRLIPPIRDAAAHLQNAIFTSIPVFLPPKVPKPEHRIDLWIGASPALGEQSAILSAFLNDLLEVMRRYGDIRIGTDEPCNYRDTERGRNALRDSLAHSNISQIAIHSGTWSDPPGHGYATIMLGVTAPVATASQISLSILPNSHDPIPAPVEACIDLIQRWFVPLGGGAAGFSHAACGTGNEGKLYQTQREREHGKLQTWDAIRCYVRGTFWGTALGPDHCERLGGQERVLREAPTSIVQPLGDGVWLQLSEKPPAEIHAVERLAEYLAPLQQWTVKDATIYRRHNVPVPQPHPHRSLPRASHILSLPRPAVDEEVTAIRMTILEKPLQGGRIGINVHLRVPPTTAQLSELMATVEEWYQMHVCAGHEQFWPYGYFLDGPTVAGTIARWNASGVRTFGRLIDWHKPAWHRELMQTVQTLSERLAALTNVDVIQLVIGTETIG